MYAKWHNAAATDHGVGKQLCQLNPLLHPPLLLPLAI